MCTVTYLPQENGDFILTSNRDETPLRKTLPPEIYQEEGIQLLYPKDQLAGGTWIGISNRARLVCMLNGGFEKHQRNLPYKVSRGIVAKDCLKSPDLINYLNVYDFKDLEPFTMVAIDWKNIYFAIEFVWDGDQKHLRLLDHKPKIWSSSTLYSSNQKALRKEWFEDWFKTSAKDEREDILQFHQNEVLGEKGYAPKMDRLFMKTVSTSRIVKNQDVITFDYYDYLENSISTMQMKLA